MTCIKLVDTPKYKTKCSYSSDLANLQDSSVNECLYESFSCCFSDTEVQIVDFSVYMK